MSFPSASHFTYMLQIVNKKREQFLIVRNCIAFHASDALHFCPAEF